MVWTLFGPMPRLSTDQAFVLCLSFKDSRFAIGLPWRAASIWACLVSLLFSFSWALASLSSPVFYYKRYWWLSGPSHLKGQRGSAAVAVITVS